MPRNPYEGTVTGAGSRGHHARNAWGGETCARRFSCVHGDREDRVLWRERKRRCHRRVWTVRRALATADVHSMSSFLPARVRRPGHRPLPAFTLPTSLSPPNREDSQERGMPMSDEIIRCAHCQAKIRLRAGHSHTRFACPRCQTMNEIRSDGAQPAAAPSEPMLVVTPAAPSVRPDIPAPVEPTVVTVPAPPSPPPGLSPIAPSSAPFLPIEAILSNGLAQGLIAAGILYLVLPELGLGARRAEAVCGARVHGPGRCTRPAPGPLPSGLCAAAPRTRPDDGGRGAGNSAAGIRSHAGRVALPPASRPSAPSTGRPPRCPW